MHNEKHDLYLFRIQQYSVDILDEDGNVFYSRLHNEPQNVTIAITSEAHTIRCKSRSAAGWSEITEPRILTLPLINLMKSCSSNWKCVFEILQDPKKAISTSFEIQRL